jgi:hypothetical protein
LAFWKTVGGINRIIAKPMCFGGVGAKAASFFTITAQMIPGSSVPMRIVLVAMYGAMTRLFVAVRTSIRRGAIGNIGFDLWAIV